LPLAFLAVLGLASAAAPEPAAPHGYVCQRAASAPKIDGRLDDGAWRAAAWTSDFVDIEGDAKPKPAHRTRAKMTWDDEYFYVGAELEEPRLFATLEEHDAVIFQDPDFEVFIDPNGDSHEYYELEINALGTTWDLLLPWPYKDGGRAVDHWEIVGLKSAVSLDGSLNEPADVDRGWTIELALPWKALGKLARRPSPPREGDQWRVNFSRVQWTLEMVDGRYRKVAGRKEDNWVWSPQGVIDMHRPEHWGYVQFTSQPAGTVAFAPDPSLAARRWLQEVYQAQREFRRAHARWARDLSELSVPAPAGGLLGSPTLETTRDLFQASVELRLTGRAAQRWNIRQDARVWPDDGDKAAP
jgi:hypothetical protein